MATIARIREHDELRKDMNSGAILLSDTHPMDEYKNKKAVMQSMRDVSSEINTIKDRLSKVDKLESDMQEIKELLRGLAK